ncbi:MAG: hypothetical protein AAGJ93_00660 [Bacteroidota bacterium]
MRKFLFDNGKLFDEMHPFAEEYGFQFKRKSAYEICLENEYCLISFYTEKYEDSLVTILTDKKTKKRYSYVDLFLAKGSPAPFLLQETSENNVLISKVITTINFLKTYAIGELEGDFSAMS